MEFTRRGFTATSVGAALVTGLGLPLTGPRARAATPAVDTAKVPKDVSASATKNTRSRPW